MRANPNNLRIFDPAAAPRAADPAADHPETGPHLAWREAWLISCAVISCGFVAAEILIHFLAAPIGQ